MSDENSPKEHEDQTELETDSSQEPSLEEQLAQAKKDHLYLLAEFDNFRKQSIKERSDLVKFGSERLIRELLEVMDNFDRALQMQLTADNLETYKSGVDMIFGEMKNLLSRHGVKEVESLGKPFDPNHHEALSSEPTDNMPPGHVSQVFKRAYKMHDRVIRPAQVVVATEPQKN